PCAERRAQSAAINNGDGEPEQHGRAAGRDHRREALGRVRVVASVDEAVAQVTAATGEAPLLVATSAREQPAAMSYRALLEEAAGSPRPLLILLGTGWGL